MKPYRIFSFLLNALFFCSTLFITSCTYDKGTEVPFDSNVSYSKDIQPIIENNCYTCHSSTATNPEKPGYAFFDDFDELKRYATKTSTTNVAYTTLQARIRHIESPGMPFNRDPLPEAKILLIENWIKAGAPNN